MADIFLSQAVGGEFKEGRGVPTGLTLSSPPLAEIAASMQYGDDPRVAFDMEREVSKRLSTLSGPSETPMDTGGAGGTYGEEEGRSPRIQEEDARSILVGMAGGSSPCVHQGLVLGADFSPCGRRIVTAGSDHTLRIWNSLTGRVRLLSCVFLLPFSQVFDFLFVLCFGLPPLFLWMSLLPILRSFSWCSSPSSSLFVSVFCVI